MITREIVSIDPVSLSEVKNILKDTQKGESDEEINYVQNKAIAHAKKFSKVAFTKAKKLEEELIESGLTKEKAIEIINVMPINRDVLRIFFSKEKRVPETEELDKIMGILDNYR